MSSTAISDTIEVALEQRHVLIERVRQHPPQALWEHDATQDVGARHPQRHRRLAMPDRHRQQSGAHRLGQEPAIGEAKGQDRRWNGADRQLFAPAGGSGSTAAHNRPRPEAHIPACYGTVRCSRLTADGRGGSNWCGRARWPGRGMRPARHWPEKMAIFLDQPSQQGDAVLPEQCGVERLLQWSSIFLDADEERKLTAAR